MPLADLPQSLLFLIFLMLFMLVGNYPAWRRAILKMRGFLKQRHEPDEPESGEFAFEPDTVAAEQTTPLTVQRINLQLTDFDIFVLRRLAQSDGQGLTRKQLDADLFLGPTTIRESLEALLRSGMVYLTVSPVLFRIRYSLSPAGREYAIEQGYIPRILSNDENL